MAETLEHGTHAHVRCSCLAPYPRYNVTCGSHVWNDGSVMKQTLFGGQNKAQRYLRDA